MREIAADANPLRRRIERRCLGVGRPVVVLDVIANPVGNCPDSPATGRKLTELAARHPGKEVGLAVAGRQGEDQQLGGDLPKGLFDGIIAEGRVGAVSIVALNSNENDPLGAMIRRWGLS